MGIDRIEHNLLNLTGKSRGIGAICTYQPYLGVSVAGGESENIPPRAVDRMPKGQMLHYNEELRAQAGHDAGKSTWSLIA